MLLTQEGSIMLRIFFIAPLLYLDRFAVFTSLYECLLSAQGSSKGLLENNIKFGQKITPQSSNHD